MARNYMTTAEAASAADVCVSTVHTWMKKYTGLGWRVGGFYRIDPDKLKRILDGSEPYPRKARR
jgi:transposase